MFKPITYLLIT